MERPAQVLIIEDHDVMRFGLSQLLDSAPGLCVCNAVGSGAEGVRALRKGAVDVVTLDLTLPDCDGLTLIGSIRKRCPNTAVMVFSMHDELRYGERAFAAGAAGYVTKDAHPEVVLAAVKKVAQGGMYISEALQSRLYAGVGQTQDGPSLSPLKVLSNRELEVLNLLGRGMSSAEIAERLQRSIKTIEAHRESIKKKLALRHSNELMRYAVRWVEEGGQAGMLQDPALLPEALLSL